MEDERLHNWSKGCYGHAKGAARKDNGVAWGKVGLASPELGKQGM